MKDPVEYFFPNHFYKNSPFSIFNQGLVDDLVASEKRMVPIKFEDFTNKFRGRMLWREHLKHVVENKLYTEEMEKAYKHLKVLNYITWLAFPFGCFIGAAVINPMYTGRSSKLLRKIVILFSGFTSLVMARNVLGTWKYTYQVQFFDYYPPHVRDFLKTKDHRYLLLFDINNAPYKLYDEATKKSLY